MIFEKVVCRGQWLQFMSIRNGLGGYGPGLEADDAIVLYEFFYN